MEKENRNITTDELALMIKKGFDETAKKSDVEEIKKILLEIHKPKIEKLEGQMKEMGDALAI